MRKQRPTNQGPGDVLGPIWHANDPRLEGDDEPVDDIDGAALDAELSAGLDALADEIPRILESISNTLKQFEHAFNRTGTADERPDTAAVLRH